VIRGRNIKFHWLLSVATSFQYLKHILHLSIAIEYLAKY